MKRKKKKETKDVSKSKKILKGAAKLSGVIAMGLLLNGALPMSATAGEFDDLSNADLMDYVLGSEYILNGTNTIEGYWLNKAHSDRALDEVNLRDSLANVSEIFTS